MLNFFIRHPHSMGETYFQHLKFAMAFGMYMIIGGVACIIHAIFPFLFQKTGSNYLLKMVHDFIDRLSQMDDRVVLLSQALEKKIQSLKAKS